MEKDERKEGSETFYDTAEVRVESVEEAHVGGSQKIETMEESELLTKGDFIEEASESTNEEITSSCTDSEYPAKTENQSYMKDACLTENEHEESASVSIVSLEVEITEQLPPPPPPTSTLPNNGYDQEDEEGILTNANTMTMAMSLPPTSSPCDAPDVVTTPIVLLEVEPDSSVAINRDPPEEEGVEDEDDAKSAVTQLRRKLAFCPICRIQYGNHKMANMCLAKHGKRQCWLCLDILPSKKEDFYRHCMEFHAISKNGDIVGCPFCGKCFDFRQGLNQHIVKIHFTESIADLDAVSSLSPNTLVDIFTGKPRASSSSSSDDFQFQQAPRVNDEQSEAATGRMMMMSGLTSRSDSPATKHEYYGGNGGVEFSGSAHHHQLPGSLQMQTLTQFRQHVGGSCSVENFGASMQFHNSSSSFRRNVYTNLSSSGELTTRPGAAAVFRDVRTLSCNLPLVQKISVPPEQTMSSIALAMSLSGPGTDPAHHHHQEMYEENELQIVENSGLYVQKYVEPGGNQYSPEPTFAPSAKPVRGAYTPLKYDTPAVAELINEANKPDIEKSFVETGEPYEKMITRVYSSNFPQFPAQQNQPFTTPVRASSNTTRLLSFNTAAAGSSEQSACAINSSANIAYSDSIGKMLKTVGELEFNSQPLRAALPNMVSPTTPPQLRNQFESELFSSAGTSPRGEEPPIPYPDSGELKFPDNCGIKRRILMKARWDENQYKKPALAHGLQATGSFLSLPASPHQNSSEFDNGTGGGGAAALGQIEAQFQQIQPTPLPPPEPIQNAGPFFEQYVKQDSRRQGDPFKLLDLTRTTEPNTMARTPSFSNSCAWNNSLQGPALAVLREPVFSSCRMEPPRQRASNPVCRSPCSHPSQSATNWNVSEGARPASYFRGRRPSNPGFWDNLRARLMMSQSSQQNAKRGGNGSGGGGADLSQTYNPISYLDCRFSGTNTSDDSVIIQNPFEEETMEGAITSEGVYNHPSNVSSKGRRQSAGSFNRNGGSAKSTQQLGCETNYPELSQQQATSSTNASFRYNNPRTKSDGDQASERVEQRVAVATTNSMAHFSPSPCPHHHQHQHAAALGKSETFRAPPSSQQATNPQTHLLPQKYPPPHVQHQQHQHHDKDAQNPAVFFTPRYAEEYHNILNRLHNLEKSRVCK